MLEGLTVALANIDEMIELIKTSQNPQEAKDRMMAKRWQPGLVKSLLDAAGATIGAIANFNIAPVTQEPEPDLPADIQQALAASPEAQAAWHDTTTIARLDWIHWITSAKQAKTRQQRISNACDMLASGKRRVCCFDPSGFYSKAFSAPKTA